MEPKHLKIHLGLVGALLAALLAAWALGRLEFFAPIWLLALLLLPVFVLLARRGMSGLPSRTNTISLTVRAVLFIILALCLAQVQYVLRNDGLCVFFVLDHSASIPEEIAQQQLRYALDSAKQAARKDSAGIVVFGDNASVEIMPQKKLELDDTLHSFVNKDYTNLQNAVQLTTAAFPTGARKKIVLITDGNENAGNLIEGVRHATGSDVEVAILPVSYDFNKEVLLEKLRLPDQVKIDEAFEMRINIFALQRCSAKLTLFRNGVRLPLGDEDGQELQLKRGRNTFTTPALKIPEPGFYVYTARISSEQDTILSNNQADAYVYIQGAGRVLFVAPTQLEVEHLMRACRAEKLEAEFKVPAELSAVLGELQNYDAIVLANVHASNFAGRQMENLRAAVRDLGIGLVMLGGADSFGAGAYLGTPIEEALPVSMDVRNRKIIPKGALVVILHTCEFSQGNYWAKVVCKKAIGALNPQDEAGVIAYQGGEDWVFRLRPVEDRRFMNKRIDSCSPGDMPSFAPPFGLARAGLEASDAMSKHIIVISDGDPSAPRPTDIRALANAGITVSTVGINPHSARDVDVLKYIAKTTGGNYYFVKNPKRLPKIFVKEAKIIQRGLFFDKPSYPLLNMTSELTKGIRQPDIPAVQAYVVTTAKDRATVALVSDHTAPETGEKYSDPILAHWRFGLGKAVAFTSDATANWGRDWVNWDMYDKFWGQVLRWVSRKRQKTDLAINTQMEGNRGRLLIDAVDARGDFINFLTLDGRMVDPKNEGHKLDIRQTAPGRYEAKFEVRDVGVSLLNIGFRDPRDGRQGFVSTGISVPYSPEYRHLKTNSALLQRAVGKLLTGDPLVDRVFDSAQPPTRVFQPVWEHLLIAALLLFFLDVIIRRVIITADDLAEAWAGVKARAPFRRRVAATKDATMSALLERKKKVFGGRKDDSKPARTGFKEQLDKAVKKKGPAAPAPDLPPPSAPAESVAPDAPAAQAKDAAKPDDGSSYTNRLLAAKRRARKKKQDE